MKIKTTARYHYIPMRMTKTKMTHHTKSWKGCERTRTLIHCWWQCKMVQLLWRMIWQFLKKLNIHLSHDPTIPSLGICLREMKILVHTKTLTQMFIEASFVIAQNWKLPKYPMTAEWLNRGIVIQWGISQQKKNELLLHTATWISLRITVVREGSQTKNENILYNSIYIKF